MKVLFHFPVNIIGGAELQLKYLIKYFSKEIDCAITYVNKELEVFIKPLGVPHYLVCSPTALASTISSVKPDVFHFYHCHEANRALRKVPNPPVAYEVVHGSRGWPGDTSTCPKDMTSVVVCVSPSAEAYFKSQRPDFPTIVIPNGVDTEVFKPLAEPKLRRPRPLGGFTGRLVDGDGKGIPEMVRLISQLPVDFELVGKDYGNFRQQIRAQGITNITVCHETNRPIDYYNRWDFFVSRSPFEGFGLSIAEALACGLPSVVFDCGGVCHYLEHGKHAFIAKTDEAMANYIRQVASGQHSLEPTSIDLSAAKMAAAYEDLFRVLIQLKKKERADNNVKIPIPQNHIYRRPVPTPQPARPAVASSVESVAIVPSGWDGIRRSLSGVVDVVMSPDEALRKVSSFRPKLIVFGGYLPAWNKIISAAKMAKCVTVLTWHGSFALNEFDPVIRASMMQALRQAKSGLFDFVATPHFGLAHTLRQFGINADYLPNIINHNIEPGPKLPGINIGIFGSGYAWKNVDCQVLAANLIKGATVHVQNYKQHWDPLPVTWQHAEHTSTEEHYRVLASMTVNLVATTTETFSYCAAESLMAGTPIVASPSIEFMRGATEPLQSCVVRTTDDPYQIAEKLSYVISHREELAELGRQHMSDVNESNKKISALVIERWKNAY